MSPEAPLNPRPATLETWVGLECSFVRVGERWSDQLAQSGHDCRLSDLDLVAAMGVRTLRYPISWERMMLGQIDWGWAEARLDRMRSLGLTPIIGFVHHGSGPPDADLGSSDFAPRLADFAHAVASRFPWIEAYTPVNEPGTTARFSGLYGVWHPHGHDAAGFARCLVHQVDAVGQAMRAIRSVNPSARLVQTEDMGKTHASAHLDYQADFENERRWLSLDLLCGRVDQRHPLYGHLRDGGIADAELEALQEGRCPPDLLGMNYYMTSERFLDPRLHHYPASMHAGNGRDAYVDVPAVRVREEGILGPAGLLREVWHRYRLPIAVTEVQLACTREEQLRWLMEVWNAARQVRGEGVDVRAVTAWALLGAHDWDSLLATERGSYESGVFDLRAPSPRPTAVARAVKALAATGNFVHPVLNAPGWWQRSRRLTQPPLSAPRTGVGPLWDPRGATAAPVLIVGTNGPLSRALVAACEERGLVHTVAALGAGDFLLPTVASAFLACHRPWAVIHCGTGLSVAAGESDPVACRRVATLVPAMLAEQCAAQGAKFLAFSSDWVFDGMADEPYVESVAPHPVTVLGQCLVELEQSCRTLESDALLIRTGVCFGLDGDADFVARTVQKLAAGGPVCASADHLVSACYLPELAHHALDLLIDDEVGLWHLDNAGAVTWYDWARTVAAMAELNPDRVERISTVGGDGGLSRRCTALASERGALMGPWQRALEHYFSVRRAHFRMLAA